MNPVFNELALPGVYEITPRRHEDERGFFSETFRQSHFAERGLETVWVQDNHSLSSSKGVLRGLHYQAPPRAQAKLIRVVRGAIFDVAVDIRAGSPTFGQWVGVVLSDSKWNQLLIPKGYAHGFVTLEPETQVYYKVSAYFSAEHDRAIRYDDPEIGVDWGLGGTEPILSRKDIEAPLLKEQDTGFAYRAAEKYG
ncbi:MAG: dTDP-4-dehydrorhamnose 3,5-epimerase [Pseudomonadota bacterium]|nr:dTDP-4-dehydrorhamnose 3,5-epimerase [Pseudomonadota bacterium]